MRTKQEYEARKRAKDAERDKKKWWFKQSDPIARLTGWLVAFTGLLFIATIASVAALIVTDLTLKNTAERQLRAYVSVILSEVRNLEIGSVPQIHIVFKNNGQTPAYAAVTWDSVSLLDFPKDSFDIGPEIETMRGGTVIGPGGEYHITRELAGPLSRAHFEMLASGKFAIYGFGRLKYRDAFNVRRTTNYRVYYGGDKVLNAKGVMSPMAAGNDAD